METNLPARIAAALAAATGPAAVTAASASAATTVVSIATASAEVTVTAAKVPLAAWTTATTWRSAGSTATTSAAETATGTSAAALTRAGFVHGEASTAEFGVVSLVDRVIHSIRVNIDESETSAFQNSGVGTTVGRKVCDQLFFGGGVGKISHVERLDSHSFTCQPSSRVGPKA